MKEAGSLEVRQVMRKPHPLYINAALRSQSSALWFGPELAELAGAQDIMRTSPEGID